MAIKYALFLKKTAQSFHCTLAGLTECYALHSGTNSQKLAHKQHWLETFEVIEITFFGANCLNDKL